MTPCVLTPQRERGEPQIPPLGLLAVNPSDRTHFSALARHYLLERHFLFNAELYSNGQFFLAGPAVGAPMASLCLEKLIALGASRIILYGWCGSLTPTLSIGDVFAPTGALSEEGTSAHYPGGNRPWDDSFQRRMLEALASQGQAVIEGPVWTTDAPYRETKEKVRRYGGQGILAVDMEYTALRAVAAFRRVQLAAVFLVSDELYHDTWQQGIGRKSFRQQSQRFLNELCALLCRTDELI